MVKSVLGVNYQGLRDWLVQRVSAIYLAIYFVALLIYFIVQQPGYYEWHGLFIQMWMKIATLFMVLCLLVHAWVGMWTIFTDYIKWFVVNLIIQMIVFIALIAFFFQALMILWGID